MPAPNEETRWNHQLPVQGARKKHDARNLNLRCPQSPQLTATPLWVVTGRDVKKKSWRASPCRESKKEKKEKKIPRLSAAWVRRTLKTTKLPLMFTEVLQMHEGTGDLEGKFPIKAKRKSTEERSQTLGRFINKSAIWMGQCSNFGIPLLFIPRGFYYRPKYLLTAVNEKGKKKKEKEKENQTFLLPRGSDSSVIPSWCFYRREFGPLFLPLKMLIGNP